MNELTRVVQGVRVVDIDDVDIDSDYAAVDIDSDSDYAAVDIDSDSDSAAVDIDSDSAVDIDSDSNSDAVDYLHMDLCYVVDADQLKCVPH